MIKQEAWVMLKHLEKEGLNKTEIGKQLNMNRKTVAKHLKSEQTPRYERRQKRRSILEPYHTYMEERLSRYCLTSYKIYEEIRKQGYQGSYETVNHYVSTRKQTLRHQAVLRFETMPGEQSQVDWGLFGSFYDEEQRRWIKLYCFLIQLGYSRTLYIEFFDDMKLRSFLKGHLNGFKYFGGYTKDILYDNLKSVVIKRALREKDSTFNQGFMDFAGYYGFQPILARPYKPNTKGKVENSVNYVRRNFFAGERFRSLSEINRRAREWLMKINRRIHATTHEKPFERLSQENLMPLAQRAYDITEIVYRKVSLESHVHFRTNRYSVPYQYAGKEVALKVLENRLQMIYRQEVIAEHEIEQHSQHQWITQVSHWEGLKALRYGSGNSQRSAPPKVHLPEVEERDLTIYEEVI